MGFFHKENQYDNYLRTGVRKIHECFHAHNYNDAYKASEELLSIFPDKKNVLKLHEKASKLLRRQRYHLVQKAFKELKALWSEKQYERLLKAYQALDTFLPNCAEVIQGLKKVQKCMIEEQKKRLEQFFKKSLQNLTSLERTGNYKEAIKIARKLLEIHPQDHHLEKILLKNVKKYVDQTLKFRFELLKRQEYDELLNMYSHLLHLMPEYGKLHQLIRECENLLRKKRIKEKKVFIEQSLVKIRNLYQERRYGRVLLGCHELLSLDSRNLRAHFWLLRGRISDRYASENELADQMSEAWGKMQEEMKGGAVSASRDEVIGITRL